MQVSRNLPYSIYKSNMPSVSPVSFMSDVPRSIQKSSCAPASVANIVLYLASQNRRRLIPPQGSASDTYVKLKVVEILTELMRTSKSGTHIYNIIYGLEKYVRDRGYKVSVEWIGYGYDGYHRTGRVLDLEWAMEKTIGPSNVMLTFGDYAYNPEQNHYTYKKERCHAVTMAGFSWPYNELFIHDPAIGDWTVPITYEFEKIKDGTLRTSCGSVLKANRFYRIREVYPNETCDTKNIKIIEGALAFEVFPR